MIRTHYIIPVVVVILTVSIRADKSDSGPYKVQFTKMEACEDTGKNEVVYEYMTEYQDGDKDRPCFTGNITLLRDVNDELSMKVSIQTPALENGTWKDHMVLSFKKGCSDTKRYEPNFFKMLNALNINVTECPIPKGRYSFKCVAFDNEQFGSQTTLKYGKYRLVKSFWDKDSIVGCQYIEGIASPA